MLWGKWTLVMWIYCCVHTCLPEYFVCSFQSPRFQHNPESCMNHKQVWTYIYAQNRWWSWQASCAGARVCMCGLRLGPHEGTKCVRCIACRDVRCRNRKKPIDLNIRGTRAQLDGSHDVRWFSRDAFMLERTSSRAEWRHSFVYPRMVPATRALV
jgi:hypothetical protein